MAEEKRPDEGKQDDVEGHRLTEDQTGDDVGGHGLPPRPTEDQGGDDVEGHGSRRPR